MAANLKENEETGVARPATPHKIATIQVKTIKGNERLILKLKFNDTITNLRSCIDKHMGAGAPAYKLQTSFPRKVLTDASMSLQEAGLTPNATIMMQAA